MNSLKHIKIHQPFDSLLFSEYGFSALTEIKSKKLVRLLKDDDEMQTSLATLKPRIDLIYSRKLPKKILLSPPIE